MGARCAQNKGRKQFSPAGFKELPNQGNPLGYAYPTWLMKYSSGFLPRCAALAGVAVLSLGSLHAQFLLNFDASQLGNPDYSPTNLWATFSSNALNASISGTSISLVSNLTPGSNPMTQSFSISDIMGAGGITVNGATSVSAYISYGTNTGFNNASSTPSPVAMSTRYTNFEFSYNPPARPRRT